MHGGQQDGVPIGITAGIYKLDSLSWTLLRDSAAGLMVDLTLLGLGSYGDAEFTYMLQLFEPVVPPSIPITTVITGCRVTGIDEKYDAGAEELVTEVSAQGLYLIRVIGGVPVNLFSLVRKLLP